MNSTAQGTAFDMEKEPTATEYLPGFAEFSAYIGHSRDLAIFSRFDELGARNLLYLQFELLALEERLHDYDDEDEKFINCNSIRDANTQQLQLNGKALEVLMPAMDWKTFVLRAPIEENECWKEIPPLVEVDNSPNGETGKPLDQSCRLHNEAAKLSDRTPKSEEDRQQQRMRTVLRIRKVIKQYQEALLLHSQILKLEPPGSRPMKVFQEWYAKKSPFLGSANSLYSRDDIVALRPNPAQDRLSKTLQKRFGGIFEQKKAVPESWGKMIFYSEKNVSRMVQMLTVLFAAIALTSAIICLYYVQGIGHRFGAFGGFLFAFVLAIGTLTSAKTSEMLAATAAYGAVLVVFIATGLQDKEEKCNCNN